MSDHEENLCLLASGYRNSNDKRDQKTADELEGAAEHIVELEAQIKPDCTWTEPSDWEYGGWETTCGEEWAFTEGDPDDNRVNFCQGCGGKVIIKTLENE